MQITCNGTAFGLQAMMYVCRSLLGCPEGRSAAGWVDYNLFGHQIVCHQVKGYNANASANAVDGDPVPVPHFGLALSVQQFHDLAERVKQADVQFVIQPHLRFKGENIRIHEDHCFLLAVIDIACTRLAAGLHAQRQSVLCHLVQCSMPQNHITNSSETQCRTLSHA